MRQRPSQSALRNPYYGSRGQDGDESYEPSPTQTPRRRGVWGLWLRLTAPHPDPRTFTDRHLRERQRRAELTSAVAPFVILSGLLLVQQALVDPITAAGLVAIWISAILALILNRAGAQATAAMLLVLGLDGAIEGTLITAHGGIGAAWLPTFDLFIIPLIAAGFLVSRRFIALFAVLHIGLILGDFYLLPHNADLAPLLAVWGTGVAFQRAVIIQVVGAALAYVAARSVDQAIARADRAEDLAAMEHQLVEQNRQVEYGIQQILQTHVRVANGDFGARAPLTQDNVLFQIASSLNNLLNRLGRAAQSEYIMQRTATEIERLRESLLAARAGRRPLWPVRTGTPVDRLIEVLAGPVPSSTLQPPSPPAWPGSGGGPTSIPPGAATSGGGGQWMGYPTDRATSGYPPPPMAPPQPMPGWQPDAVPWESPSASPDPGRDTASPSQFGTNPPGSGANSWDMPPMPDLPPG